MNTIKVLYVFVLSTLLVLTGCFGSGIIDDSEGQATDETGTNGNNGGTTSTGTHNSEPYIDARITGVMAEGMEIGLATPMWETALEDLEEDEEPVLAGFSMPLYHAVMDLDGTVTTMGWDLDLDGTIDIASNGKRGLTNVNISLSEFVSISQAYMDMMVGFTGEEISEEDQDEIDEFLAGPGQYMVTSTVAFIAIDDGGATSAMMVNIDQSIVSLFYVWASSLSENTPDITLTQYKAEDHPSATSNDMTDNLMRLSFVQASEDLEWNLLTITLFDEEDGQTFTCSPNGVDCTIGQETADSVWAAWEVISIAEGGTTDICGAAGSDEGNSCELKIIIWYDGFRLSGTSGIVAVA